MSGHKNKNNVVGNAATGIPADSGEMLPVSFYQDTAASMATNHGDTLKFTTTTHNTVAKESENTLLVTAGGLSN